MLILFLVIVFVCIIGATRKESLLMPATEPIPKHLGLAYHLPTTLVAVHYLIPFNILIYYVHKLWLKAWAFPPVIKDITKMFGGDTNGRTGSTQDS